MPDTGNPTSPLLLKGAFIQKIDAVGGVRDRIIPFQYNPELLSRSIEPWNPFEVDETDRGQQSPTVQPFDPKEKIDIKIELDAADRLEDQDPETVESGIDGRIAAFEQLLFPDQGLPGALTDAERSLNAAGNKAPTPRATVPILIFVFGPGRMVPVRISSYSIEEQNFSPTLHPIRAVISLSLEVLTPDVFKCADSPSIVQAIDAYNEFRRQRTRAADREIARSAGARLAISGT